VLPRKYAEPLSGVRGTPPHDISASICHSSTRRPAFRACVQSFVRPSPRAQSLSNSSGKIFGLNSVERNIIDTTLGKRQRELEQSLHAAEPLFVEATRNGRQVGDVICHCDTVVAGLASRGV
jgi:hypothetical protein